MEIIEKYLDTRQQLFKNAGIQPECLTVETNGPVKKVHYLKTGSGSPLVLVHGGGGNSSEWINILKPLAEKFSLYVLDRPGSGLTDAFNYKNVNVPQHGADFIESFLNAVNLKQASFLAQSMGAYFVLNFALKHPERINRLICIGAPAGLNLYIPLPLRLMGTPFLNRVLLGTVFRPTPGNVKKFHEMLLVTSAQDIPEVYFDHISCHQRLPGWAGSFFSLLENLLNRQGWKKEYYVGDKLERLKVPVDFIWGENDAFEHPDSGRAKAKSVSGYRFEVVNDAGHCPWLDKPEQCVNLISRFFENR